MSGEPNNLRVLFSFPHILGRVGIGTTAWHQARGLVDRGLDVTVLAARIERPVDGARRLIPTLRLGGVPLRHKVLGRRGAAAWHDRRVAGYLQRHAADFDLMHAWPDGALRTLRRARRLGLPSLMERPNAHIDYATRVVAEEARRVGYDPPKSHSHTIDARRLAHERAEYAAADRLLCPSDFVARTFREQGIPAGKLTRHRYGYAPADFEATARPAEAGRGLRAVFVGRGEPRKGVHYLLEAWLNSKASNTGQLTLCGAFLPGYLDRLRPQIDHPSVRQIGFTRQVRQHLLDSDVLVLPSVEEGSALVTYEARGCGVALMVSDAAGACCRDGHDALVHRAGDVPTLTRQFDRLAAEPPLLATLRRHTLAERDRYTWAGAAESLEAAYRRLLAEARPEPPAAPTAAAFSPAPAVG
jgi:glycosyltransferase involved in cell wall biosynthesis